MMQTPPNIKKNVKDALHPYPYVTDLAAATDAFSLDITTKFVTSSYTSLNGPSPLTAYA